MTHFNVTHGMRYLPEYQAWCQMKARCYRKTIHNYSDYGGRGITVCERWKNSFEAFYHDIGARPSESHSLDRIDNNGDYEPGNVRWATAREQSLNRRIRKENISGYTGVTWYKYNQTWASKIRVNGELIHLGYFKEIEEAAIARDQYILDNELSQFILQILPEF